MHHHGEQPGEDARRPDESLPPPTPYARSYRVHGITVVQLLGEIDLGAAEHVDRHLAAAALSPAPLLVVLDLCAAEFIDCFGLSLLLRGRRRVLDRGGRVRMACDRAATRKLLAMTGLDGVFHPFRTLDEALAHEPPES
ncbi:anti-sigma factor antagonist [Actinacidiphila acidipaludis]|uniref:Anti-sigma factor antagonist n=1 Tax=Actinacidiphila acidipaludis TaxID=2873382 RepID=A0ABS7QCY8_9ACTN|nr:anti-sigma factor antagonist [Streptomyces acidipaludis]MBY8880549.1 STAS domain-containing protein [Streptomyces acidipaludis]